MPGDEFCDDSVVRIGIVGTGVGIRTYLPSILGSRDLELAGIVGSSVDRARMHLSSAGVSPDFACEWGDLLAAEPDLICITTSIDVRWPYVGDLRQFNGALLFEKPVIAQAGDRDALLNALGGRANRAYTDFQLRGLQAFQFVRSRVVAGALGDVYAVTLFERNSGLRCGAVPEWMLSRTTGGGQMFSMGSHLLDLAVFITGHGYNDVASPCDSRGYASTPRGSWVPNDVPCEPADESFICTVGVGDCRVAIATTAISPGPRTLAFTMEGSDGCAEFAYASGVGELRLWNSDGSTEEYRVGDRGTLVDVESERRTLDASIFRVAHPSYMEMLARVVRGQTSACVATLSDGISNATVLLNAVRD